MPETVAGVVSAVTSEAGVDEQSATVLAWLNRRWRQMVGRSRAYRATVTIGSTVAGQAFYPVTGVFEMLSLEVAGVPWGRARRPDIYGYSQGTLVWDGPPGSGLVVVDASAAAAQGLTFIPVPATSGLAITSYAVTLPGDLTIDSAGDTLLNAVLGPDLDMVEGLISGVMATAHRRDQDYGSAQAAEADFAGAMDEWRRRVARRLRAGGPAHIRIEGVNA